MQCNVGRGHAPADHGSILYTNVPAMDALCVIFRPENFSVVGGVMTPPYIALHIISPLNYNLPQQIPTGFELPQFVRTAQKSPYVGNIKF